MTDRGPGILTEIIVTEQDINDIIPCLDPKKASGIVALFLDLRIYITVSFSCAQIGGNE
jgi:hypothetical protein